MDNIQKSLEALQDSVYEINRIINGNLTEENNISFLKANIDHLNIMLEKQEINTALVGQDRANVENAIAAGTDFYSQHNNNN